ncbi:MAG: MerR family transcriptional regulator, partial [Verrucomicrobiales bacterium]
MDEVFGIGAVVRRTGLSAQGIRMWEKRYDAVVPKRSDTNRRLYRREDVERLVRMKQLTEAGHSISSIAGLSLEQLERLAADLGDASVSDPHALRVRETRRVLVFGASLAWALESVGGLEMQLVEVIPSFDDARHLSELPETDLVLI